MSVACAFTAPNLARKSIADQEGVKARASLTDQLTSSGKSGRRDFQTDVQPYRINEFTPSESEDNVRFAGDEPR